MYRLQAEHAHKALGPLPAVLSLLVQLVLSASKTNHSVTRIRSIKSLLAYMRIWKRTGLTRRLHVALIHNKAQ